MEDAISYVPYWRRDRHLTWSFETREGLAVFMAKALPSFLSYFKTLSIGPVPGIEPATSRSAVKRSTDWATKHSIVFYQQKLMEEGLETWLQWTHTGQKEVSQWPPDQAVPFPRFLDFLLMKE